MLPTSVTVLTSRRIVQYDDDVISIWTLPPAASE
jgi:hypothetical protein